MAVGAHAGNFQIEVGGKRVGQVGTPAGVFRVEPKARPIHRRLLGQHVEIRHGHIFAINRRPLRAPGFIDPIGHGPRGRVQNEVGYVVGCDPGDLQGGIGGADVASGGRPARVGIIGRDGTDGALIEVRLLHIEIKLSMPTHAPFPGEIGTFRVAELIVAPAAALFLHRSDAERNIFADRLIVVALFSQASLRAALHCDRDCVLAQHRPLVRDIDEASR